MYVSNFESLTPPYLVEQEKSLDWLASAHARAGDPGKLELYRKMLGRFGCGPEQINQRGSFLEDFAHQEWDRMEIFGQNAGLDVRQAHYKLALRRAVPELYRETLAGFQNWIHVSCTGYVAPSIAQVIASERGWDVEHLNAYHMGCYAAIPALRMARGNFPADILHTELCTTHLDPTRHEPEQMVIQTLFADGIIRYRVDNEKPTHGYRIEELRETMASHTLGHMTWDVGGQAFRMTLAREVPLAVRDAIQGVLRPWRQTNTVYAIHPGGPRIIDAVKDALDLSEEQVHFSREILRRHGNMSSATLPHVWQRMLFEVAPGTPVISVAFGPGLTIAASLMRAQ